MSHALPLATADGQSWTPSIAALPNDSDGLHPGFNHSSTQPTGKHNG